MLCLERGKVSQVFAQLSAELSKKSSVIRPDASKLTRPCGIAGINITLTFAVMQKASSTTDLKGMVDFRNGIAIVEGG
jgi:hypothetical protein